MALVTPIFCNVDSHLVTKHLPNELNVLFFRNTKYITNVGKNIGTRG